MRKYQECAKCVMDTSDPLIRFDKNGVCNHCLEWEQKAKQFDLVPEIKKKHFDQIIQMLIKNGIGKDYDCVIGLSGGIDSTYLAYLLVRNGVRPLAVHLDNGWDSELAVMNIENIVKKLNIEYITHVLDWDEFKLLQLSFLKASTPDSEIPSDHAINALMYKTAVARGIKFVVNGVNHQTESHLPRHWSTGHLDWKYIQSVHRNFCNTPLSNYPHFTYVKFLYWLLSGKLKVISLLDYVEYNKQNAKKIVETELGWRDYGGKHYESIYTRFFQGYILPEKFGIDKRRSHFSSQICDGTVHRDDAIKELNTPPYDSGLLHEDMDYVMKKFDMTTEEFDNIMKLPIKTYWDYPNCDIQNKWWYANVRRVYHNIKQHI